jgi:hypothetical protein
MSPYTDPQAIEAALRLSRLQFEAQEAEDRRARMKRIQDAEFKRLIFQDLGRQAGELYRRQLQSGKDCA